MITPGEKRGERRRRWWPLLPLCVAATTAACTVFTSFTGYVGSAEGGGSSSSDDDGGIVFNGTGDGGPSSTSPVTIAIAGQLSNATGLASQAHLVWAESAAEWILFYYSDAAASALRSRVSKNFVDWVDGPDLALPYPHDNEPRNFSVATAVVGSIDIIHVAVSIRVNDKDRRHFHARGAVTGGTLAFGSVGQVCNAPQGTGMNDPDGPAVAIANDGHVYDFTGFMTNNPNGTGGTSNEFAFRSQNADDGTFDMPAWDETDIETVPNASNGRAAVTLAGSDVLAFWENGKSEPEPNNVRSGKMSGGSTSGPQVDVFRFDTPFDVNDWGVLRVSPNEVHAARFRDDGKVDHASWDGSSWNSLSQVPMEPLQAGAGVVLVRTAGGVRIVGVNHDTHEIRATTWNGSDHSDWTTLAAAVGARSGLTVAPGKNGISAIAWTEPAPKGSAAIVGMLVQ